MERRLGGAAVSSLMAGLALAAAVAASPTEAQAAGQNPCWRAVVADWANGGIDRRCLAGHDASPRLQLGREVNREPAGLDGSPVGPGARLVLRRGFTRNEEPQRHDRQPTTHLLSLGRDLHDAVGGGLPVDHR